MRVRHEQSVHRGGTRRGPTVGTYGTQPLYGPGLVRNSAYRNASTRRSAPRAGREPKIVAEVRTSEITGSCQYLVRGRVGCISQRSDDELHAVGAQFRRGATTWRLWPANDHSAAESLALASQPRSPVSGGQRGARVASRLVV